jgi:hypothetical protein
MNGLYDRDDDGDDTLLVEQPDGFTIDELIAALERLKWSLPDGGNTEVTFCGSEPLVSISVCHPSYGVDPEPFGPAS